MSTSAGARDLVLVTAAVIGLSALIEGPIAWLTALVLAAAVAVGSLQVLGEADATPASGVPLDSLLVPTVTAFAGVGVIRLVPVGYLLVPAVALLAWYLDRVLATEARILRSPHGPTPGDRTAVQVEAIVSGALAFGGVAALIPGGLPGVGGGPVEVDAAGLVGLVVADAAVAGAIGWRMAALRVGAVRDLGWFALTTGSVIGIGALALRAVGIQRLLGPALLAVVLFLWDAIHAATPASRRDARRIWETVLLAVLAIAVVAWSMILRP